MITETISGDRVFRKSDNNVYIKKIGTDEKYAIAEDYTNEWRIRHGLSVFNYIETEVEMPTEEE